MKPQVPGLKVPDPPRVDLGFPFGHSERAQNSVAEMGKGMYLAGGMDGYSIGQTVGYVAGHASGVAEGVVIGTVVTSATFLTLALITIVLLKVLRSSSS